MSTLQEYLTGAFHTDRQDVDAIDHLIIEAARTLVSSFTNAGWPYEVDRRRGLRPPDKPSVGTTAMTAVAISRLLGLTEPRPNERHAASFPFDGLEKELKTELRQTQANAFQLLFGQGAIQTNDVPINVPSTTFGKNDALTALYLVDLASVKREANLAQLASLRSYASHQRQVFQQIDPNTSHDRYFHPPPRPGSSKILDNAFIPLRATQIIRQADLLLRVPTKCISDLNQYVTYFETILHTQLCYSTIPDSRFDPAELAFCLEGLLLSHADALDPSTMSRVMDVLRRAQIESAYWRPVKPIMANERGEVLFPVSVEVANSLMRSCELFDQKQLYNTFSSSCIDLFRRYWLWLQARAVRFKTEARKNGSRLSIAFLGWHSEHVNEPDLFHVWETSQVLEFLINFRRLLKGHIARTTLIASRFSLRDPDRKDARKRQWSTICEDYEPVALKGNQYRIYKRIGCEFIDGWLANNPIRYSLLLYGPPGTGKRLWRRT